LPNGKCPPKPKTPKAKTPKAKTQKLRPCKYGERLPNGKCPPKPKTPKAITPKSRKIKQVIKVDTPKTRTATPKSSSHTFYDAKSDSVTFHDARSTDVFKNMKSNPTIYKRLNKHERLRNYIHDLLHTNKLDNKKIKTVTINGKKYIEIFGYAYMDYDKYMKEKILVIEGKKLKTASLDAEKDPIDQFYIVTKKELKEVVLEDGKKYLEANGIIFDYNRYKKHGDLQILGVFDGYTKSL
jgi:hypothetical protein